MTGRGLLVIDMLEDFLREDGALFCGPTAASVVPAVAERIAVARSVADTVIYVCDRHRPDDPEFRMFPVHCLDSTAGAKIIGELQPDTGDPVIAKRRFSGFVGTELDITLRDMGIREVELTGVCTNICVLYTAADARSLGYEVRVFSHAVASFDADAHHFALREMERTLGVQVVWGGEQGESDPVPG